MASFEEESAASTVRDVQAGDHMGDPFYTAGMTEPISRLVDWYNNLEHMSLKDGMETPVQAYKRKQPPQGITSQEMEEDTHA